MMDALLLCEVGMALHQERVNRAMARMPLETWLPPRRTPRQTLASGLVAVAAWLAPATPTCASLERAASGSSR